MAPETGWSKRVQMADGLSPNYRGRVRGAPVRKGFDRAIQLFNLGARFRARPALDCIERHRRPNYSLRSEAAPSARSFMPALCRLDPAFRHGQPNRRVYGQPDRYREPVQYQEGRERPSVDEED